MCVLHVTNECTWCVHTSVLRHIKYVENESILSTLVSTCPPCIPPSDRVTEVSFNRALLGGSLVNLRRRRRRRRRGGRRRRRLECVLARLTGEHFSHTRGGYE